jgi:hypothetical protein
MHQIRIFMTRTQAVVVLAATLLLSPTAWTFAVPFAGDYDNREGSLFGDHSRDLESVRSTYFYDQKGELDLGRVTKLRDFLIEQRRLLKSSAKLNRKTNLIDVHGVGREKAEKEGLQALDEEAETIAPVNFALESVEYILKNGRSLTRLDLERKVETALLWYVAAYTVHPKGIFTSAIERARNLSENFFDYRIDERGGTPASNLLEKAGSQRILGLSEIQNLQRRGFDLSRLDPPSSAFWVNNRVEDYDPDQEIYFGQRLFPPKSIAVPVFEYERMGNGQVKFKTKWKDESERTKKGKPKEKSVTLRVGWEAYTATVVNHLARALGYPAIPTTHRAKVKLLLGETSLEEFLSQYKSVHTNEMGSALTHIRRIPGENAIYVLNATLEAYPDDEDYRRIGPFRMGANGFPNRREYRAMVLYNSLISLQDQFEYQARVDAYRDPDSGEWRPLFFIADTSSAMGLPAMLGNKGTVNEFTWKFTKRTDSKIWLFWLSVFDSRAWRDATYSDLKWMARRMARLHSSQIDRIMMSSGFPRPVQELYADKLKSRLNQMILDFQLEREGFRLHSLKGPIELSQLYPDYIDANGFLKEKAQEIAGNTAPVLGNRFTPYQGIVVLGINALQNQFLKVFAPAKLKSGGQWSFDLGQVRTQQGVLFDASRDVIVNPEVGGNHRRYLLRDTLAVSIPIGFDNERLKTPVALYYTWKFEYLHSVSTMKEVGSSRFFDLLNPFSINEIRRNLAHGEQLLVSHSYGAAIGHFKLKALEDLQIEANLLGISRSHLKTLYFSKHKEGFLEVASNQSQSAVFRNGFDLRAIVRLGLMSETSKSKSHHDLYRIDLLNMSSHERLKLEEGFERALVFNDFEQLDAIAPPKQIEEKKLGSAFNLNLFLFGFERSSTVTDLKIGERNVILATQSTSSDRAFDRLWNEKIDTKSVKAPVNYIGNFWNEGQLLDISFEGLVAKHELKFEAGELNISLAKLDNYATRIEFEQELKPFFNLRSGQSAYIDFVMPDGLKAYPEFLGVMRWQLSFPAIVDIMRKASDWKNLEFLLPENLNTNTEISAPLGDPREEVSYRAQRFLVGLGKLDAVEDGNTRLPREILREHARNVVLVIQRLIGEDGERLGLLRKWTRDDKIWVLTSFENVLDLSHPSFRTTKGQIYYAPEVGNFQGHSFLNDFRRKNLVKPILAE